MRVEWVEVLSYELEKNVAFGRRRREGISSDEQLRTFKEMRSKREKIGSLSVNSGVKSRNVAKTNRIGFGA